MTSEAATTTGAPDAQTPTEVVESSYAAFNSGDLEAWLSHYTEDAAVSGIRRADAPDRYAALFAANARRDLEGSCEEGKATAEGLATVTCAHVDTNEFQGPAGFSVPRTMTYIVTDDSLIAHASVVAAEYSSMTRYNTMFWFWLEEAHPDVYAAIDPALELRGDDPGTGSKFPHSAAAMTTSLPYVDEFVAQSTDYPLEPTG